MADARSLLRAQRAARRVNHPHAVYTDSGKLTCAVCREPIKSDAQWDAHARGASHRQRLLAQQKARAAPLPQAPEPPDDPSANAASSGATPGKSKPSISTDTPTDEALLAQIISGGGAGEKKRKHSADEDADVDMADAALEEDDDHHHHHHAARSKRSKHDMTTTDGPMTKRDSPDTTTSKNSKTPPSLTRQKSGTPSHGVEIQIPSRPATPSASATSATSTPKGPPMGRSPLIPHDAPQQTGGAPKPAPKAAFVTPDNTDTETAPATAAAGAAANGGDGDDDWAAFEAEVVHAAPAAAASRAEALSNDAVISAAPLTAEQLAARAGEEERAKRRMQADVDIEDEQEEATRALEDEFEEMEELEARVRRLREKMNAIRRGSVAGPAGAAPGGEANEVGHQAQQQPVNGNGAGIEEKGESDDEDDDEEDDEDDDWAGFRFRA